VIAIIPEAIFRQNDGKEVIGMHCLSHKNKLNSNWKQI